MGRENERLSCLHQTGGKDSSFIDKDQCRSLELKLLLLHKLKTWATAHLGDQDQDIETPQAASTHKLQFTQFEFEAGAQRFPAQTGL